MSIWEVETIEAAGAAPLLLQPVAFRSVTLRNRIVVSPMAMYSAHDGFADDFHLVHLGRFALGGAGLVFIEATAVTEQGRITAGCNGLWLDAQIPQLKRITDFLHRFGSAAGMQLAHSGWKGSSRRPWHGGTRLDDEDVKLCGEHAWPIVSVGDEFFDGAMPGPTALTESDLSTLLESYRAATRRAIAAGFDVIDVHAAHGYLLHSFLSPLSNKRSDRYGGGIENRMRFPLAVVEAVRAEWPADKPLFVRISSVDGVDIGWTIEDLVKFAKALAARGVDVVDCSVEANHHLIVMHEVTNDGTDRSQLSHVANETKAALGVEKLDAVADRGYFNSEEIRACEEAGITVTLPKPMTSNAKAEGRFGKQDFRYVADEDIYVCPAGEKLAYHYTTEENSLVLRRYWTNVCQSCAIKAHLHHRQGTTDHPMGT